MTENVNAFETILGCVEAFRAFDRDIQLGSIIAFLHICDNEGAPIKNLAHRCGFSESSMSRYVHSLSLGAAVRPGLVEIVAHPDDRRRRLVFLTAAGANLKDELRKLII